jgi:riboflavin kinase / FMN adenylyltransferase
VEIVQGLAQLRPGHGPAFVVVGVFDGLHLGHRYLLRHLVAEARQRDANPIVITFDHHPDEVVRGSAPPLLCDPEERVVHLAADGVAATVVQHFDQALRETSFEDFVGMITERAELAGFLMTPESAFGYQRRGTPEALAALGRERGFDVVVIPPFELDGRPVRSTEIRTAIAAGDLDAAHRLLGRDHAVVGTVGDRTAGAGEGNGATLAFDMPYALPPEGTYAATLEPAWQFGHPQGRVIEGAATLVGGSVRIEPIPGSGRVRVGFRH